MARKITETTERFCCEPRDLEILEPIKTIVLSKQSIEYQKLDRYCKHCGQIFEYYSFMDAAGSPDYGYRQKELKPKFEIDATLRPFS